MSLVRVRAVDVDKSQCLIVGRENGIVAKWGKFI